MGGEKNNEKSRRTNNLRKYYSDYGTCKYLSKTECECSLLFFSVYIKNAIFLTFTSRIHWSNYFNSTVDQKLIGFEIVVW